MTPVHSECHRAVIVRDGPGLSELADAIRRSRGAGAPELHEVDDLFDALAIISDEDDSGGTVSTVAVPLRATGDEPHEVRDAFRRVDPAVRLVLLAPRGAATVAAEAGFDEIVFLPAASADLAAALQIPLQTTEYRGDTSRTGASAATDMGDYDGAPDRSMRTERRPPSRGVPSGNTPPNAPLNRGEGERAPDRDVVGMVIDDALQAFAARAGRATGAPTRPTPAPQIVAPPASSMAAPPTQASPVGEAPAGDTGGVGDTDLVNAILEGGDRLVTLALRLVRTELGADDLRLLAATEATREARPRETRVPVHHGEAALGCLTTALLDESVLRPWADWLGHWLALDRAHEELRRLAWTDQLTGAGNRRAFERVLDETISAARGQRRPVTLMYFDIDNFKLYNDRFGHDAGDEVLRETVELLRASIRRGDHVFRVGGDEFVVIFADSRGGRADGSGGESPLESVELIATRFRERVRALRFPQLGLEAPGTVSVSAGVATYPWDGQDAPSLLSHADQLSLQSKRSGKNMITFGPGARDHCHEA